MCPSLNPLLFVNIEYPKLHETQTVDTDTVVVSLTLQRRAARLFLLVQTAIHAMSLSRTVR